MSMDELDDIDYSQIPVSSLTVDTNEIDGIEDVAGSSFDVEMKELSTRVAQYQWVVTWLEKNKLYKTLDVLLDEGADIASESFSLGKTVEVDDSRDDYAKAELSTWDVHHGQNILVSRFHPTLDLVATGSTDRTVIISNWKTGEKLTTIYGAHIAPILAIDWHPTNEGRLALGSLDNSASVVQLHGISGPASGVTYDIVAQLKIHTKHVVRVKWSPDGRYLATASYDQSLKVLEEKANASEGDEHKFVEVKVMPMGEAVESIVWTPDSKWLIASVRKDNYLHYFETSSGAWQESKFNMNAAQHDDHVSFTAMDIVLSKDGKNLLVTTDHHRAIMYVTGTPLQVRVFYDIPNGEWSTPRAAFNQSGHFVYISGEDKCVHVFDTSNATKVTTLSGHTSNVRDLCAHPTQDIICTSSFDKTIKIWQ